MFTQQPQIPRSPFASTLTLLFHVCLGVGVIALGAIPTLPKVVERERLTFVVAAAPPPNFEYRPPPPPAPVRIEPRPVPKPVEALERPVVMKTPVAPPLPERKPEPLPPTPVAPTTSSALPRAAVVVGTFADATTARKPEARVNLTPTGFDNAGAQATRARRDVVVTDFDAASASARTARVAQISDAGFGGAAAVPATRQAPRDTTASGFSDSTRAPEKKAALVSQPTDFAASPAAAKTAQAPRAQVDHAVEVLFKPSPAYSDEARAQRVEGDVVLEVEFTAGGQVRILRVVKGLGFGLDEMARRATEQIRFRPATSAGVPVDFRAQLTVVFRLT